MDKLHKLLVIVETYRFTVSYTINANQVEEGSIFQASYIKHIKVQDELQSVHRPIQRNGATKNKKHRGTGSSMTREASRILSREYMCTIEKKRKPKQSPKYVMLSNIRFAQPIMYLAVVSASFVYGYRIDQESETGVISCCMHNKREQEKE